MQPNRLLLTALAFAVVVTADARAHRGRDPLAELGVKARAAQAALASGATPPRATVPSAPAAPASRLPAQPA